MQGNPYPHASKQGGKLRCTRENAHSSVKGSVKPCHSCTHTHAPGKVNWPAKDLICDACEKKGHLQAKYHGGQPNQSNATGNC